MAARIDPRRSDAARAAALQAGQKRYHGKACIKHPGLRGERYTSSCGCVVCSSSPTRWRNGRKRSVKTPRPVSARRLAEFAGERTYSTGQPCKHGHLAPRWTVSGTCVVCKLAHGSRRYWLEQASC